MSTTDSPNRCPACGAEMPAKEPQGTLKYAKTFLLRGADKARPDQAGHLVRFGSRLSADGRVRVVQSHLE